MKKLLSASIMMMITAAAFSQDTIPPQTVPPSTLDTIPANRSQKDSADWNDKMRSKDDTSTLDRSRSSQDSMRANWPADSVNVNKDMDTRSESQATDTLSSMNNNTDSLSNATGNNNTDATNSNQATTGTESGTEQLTDRVIMKEDSMYIIRNGETMPLTEEFKLESGTTVATDGTVKYVSGKTATLKNGQFIELSANEGSSTKEDKKKMKKAIKAEKKKKKNASENESE